MAAGRTDSCCNCASLCGIYCLILWGGLIQYPLWAALQAVFFFTGTYDRTRCGSPEGLAAESANNSGLKLIIPSAGISGTTSIHIALCKMGVRSFHQEERGFWLPATMLNNASGEDFARSISRCRVEVLFLEPTTDVYHRVLEVSPDAKVLMTWRSHPSWVHSVKTGHGWRGDIAMSVIGILTALPYHMISWDYWWDYVSAGKLESLWHEAPVFGCPGYRENHLFVLVPISGRDFGSDVDLRSRGIFKAQYDEEGYIAIQDEIRRLTPPDRLVEFDIRKHGWKELEGVLGMSAGDLSNEPFPRARSGLMWLHSHIMADNPWGYARFYAFTICVALLEFYLLKPLLRVMQQYLWLFCQPRNMERWWSRGK